MSVAVAAHGRGRFPFVLVSDRLPGAWSAARGSAGAEDGLYAALRPVIGRRNGIWTGRQPQEHGAALPEDLAVRPVPVAAEELVDYLDGQCDATIAPLYHDAVDHAVFRREWRDAYRAVNERFAHTVADIAAPGATVWIHDYHLQLVPGLLRALRPDLLIGFFLHVPFPPAELFRRLPLRTEILTGLLGADLIGFQRRRAARNFLDLAADLPGHRVHGDTVTVHGRRIEVGVFPLSVDSAAIAGRVDDPPIRQRARAIRAQLGEPRTVLLAVDELSVARGVEQRLTAYGELLAERRLNPADTVLVQLARPLRGQMARGRDVRVGIERSVARINGVHARVGRPTVHYLHQQVTVDELLALFLAADALLATPLRDAMTLIAKEFVASRTDGTGALVLSEFTGAAADLPQAICVNPHDIDALKSAVLAACDAGTTARRDAMRQMREHVRVHDVHAWAQRFLAALDARAAQPTGTVHRPRRRDLVP